MKLIFKKFITSVGSAPLLIRSFTAAKSSLFIASNNSFVRSRFSDAVGQTPVVLSVSASVPSSRGNDSRPAID